MQCIEEVEAWTSAAWLLAFARHRSPVERVRRPLRQKWIADPLIVDGAFQMMILWSVAQSGAPGLPCYVAGYRQYRRASRLTAPRRAGNRQGHRPPRAGRSRFPGRRRAGDRPHGRRRMYSRRRPGTCVPTQPAARRSAPKHLGATFCLRATRQRGMRSKRSLARRANNHFAFMRSIRILAVSGRMTRASGSSPARSFSRSIRPAIDTCL